MGAFATPNLDIVVGLRCVFPRSWRVPGANLSIWSLTVREKDLTQRTSDTICERNRT